nr:uncharacterized protein LOC119618334 [Chlorocebus sabaeus]
MRSGALTLHSCVFCVYYGLFLECPLLGLGPCFLAQCGCLGVQDRAGRSRAPQLLSDRTQFPAGESAAARSTSGWGGAGRGFPGAGRGFPGPAQAPPQRAPAPTSPLGRAAGGQTVLFPLASLALSAAATKTRNGGATERRSGAAPRGTSLAALGGRAGHAQSAGPPQLSE